MNPNQIDEYENYTVDIPLDPEYNKLYEFDEDRKLLLTRDGNLMMGWYYFGHTSNAFSVRFIGVPGTSPAVGSCSEWDVRNNKPFIGDANFYTLGVMRKENEVVVIGSHSYGNPLHCGCCFIANLA